MVPHADFFMMMAMELGNLVLLEETRTEVIMLAYAVIGKMDDVAGEISAVSDMMVLTVESRFVLIGSKDAVLVVAIANFSMKVQGVMVSSKLKVLVRHQGTEEIFPLMNKFNFALSGFNEFQRNRDNMNLEMVRIIVYFNSPLCTIFLLEVKLG